MLMCIYVSTYKETRRNMMTRTLTYHNKYAQEHMLMCIYMSTHIHIHLYIQVHMCTMIHRNPNTCTHIAGTGTIYEHMNKHTHAHMYQTDKYTCIQTYNIHRDI